MNAISVTLGGSRRRLERGRIGNRIKGRRRRRTTKYSQTYERDKDKISNYFIRLPLISYNLSLIPIKAQCLKLILVYMKPAETHAGGIKLRKHSYHLIHNELENL